LCQKDGREEIYYSIQISINTHVGSVTSHLIAVQREFQSVYFVTFPEYIRETNCCLLGFFLYVYFFDYSWNAIIPSYHSSKDRIRYLIDEKCKMF
jgi:hypothetical protein